MEDLIKKLGHKIPEVSDRAVRTLHSKLSTRVVSAESLLEIDNGLVAGLSLHWINERQKKAELNTVNSALQIVSELSGSPTGHRILTEIGAVEFFNAYFNYAPNALQSIVSSILNALVSPNFTPLSQRLQTTIVEKPAMEAPRVPPRQPVQKEVLEQQSIVAHSECPPVMLCESDEKFLFDLGVTLKFGSPEEIIDSCEQIAARVFADFPVDCLLQRRDLITTVVQLAKSAAQKAAPHAALKALELIEVFMKKMQDFARTLGSPEFRPPSVLPKQKSWPEFIELAHPSLDVSKWQTGTPGPTLSLVGAAELILQGIPLDHPALTGHALAAWQASLWALPYFLPFPNVLSKLLTGFSAALAYADPLHKKAILTLATQVVRALPPQELGKVLAENPELVNQLADSILFQGEEAVDLLPYVEAADSEIVKEFRHAQALQVAIDGSTKVKQMLALERALPIDSPAMFYKALEFFAAVLPSVEFVQDAPIAAGVIDLNIYSYILSQDSGLDAKQGEAHHLLLSLLASPLSHVREDTLRSLEEALSGRFELEGLGGGYTRGELAKRVMLQEPILGELIVQHDGKLLPILLETPEDYRAVSKYFTVIQALAAQRAELAGIVVFLTNLVPQAQPLRFVRDLFSANVSQRMIAAQVLRGSKSPEAIQKAWSAVQSSAWELSGTADPVAELTEPGELDLTEPLDCSHVSAAESETLLGIAKSPTIELSLKLASAEQIVMQLLDGHFPENLIEDTVSVFVQLLTEEHPDDRVSRKLLAKALQALLVSALNYPSRARKLYQGSVKFVCRLVPYAFHHYYEVKYYALYLLFVLCFSHAIERNAFIPSGAYALVPEPLIEQPRSRLRPVVVNSLVLNRLKHPFLAQRLIINYNSTITDAWAMVPSSERVTDYLFRRSPLDFDGDRLLDAWGRQIHAAETHAEILRVVAEWASHVAVSRTVHRKLFEALLSVESGVLSGALSLLRSVPTNRTEDTLHARLLTNLRGVYVEPGRSAAEFDFANNLSQLLQRNLLTFIAQLSNFDGREPLVLEILMLLDRLMNFHGTKHPTLDTNLQVLSRFQLQPGEVSVLSTISSILRNSDNFTIYEKCACVLRKILRAPSFSLPLDLTGSPSSKNCLIDCLNQFINKFLPFASASTFLHAGVLREVLRLFIAGRDFLNSESFLWLIRLTEHRQTAIRIQAWSLVMSIPLEVFSAAPSSLEAALEVLFAQKESYGVKSRAAGYVCSLLQASIRADLDADLIKTLNSYGAISHIKNLLYENAGAPGSYFGSLVKILNCMAILDFSRVAPVCTQLDIWDALVRLIRPGALLERANNDPRAACSPFLKTDLEDTVIGLTEILQFTNLIMRNDVQITDYLLEGTHIASYCVDWLADLSSNFEETRELLFGGAYLQLVQCLHLMAQQLPGKTRQSIERFPYAVLADIMDSGRSFEVKVAIGRLLTAVLGLFQISEEAERLCLSLIALYKSEELSLAASQDVLHSLSALLLYSEQAKTAALDTGFANYLFERGLDLVRQIETIDIQKTKKGEELVVRQTFEVLVLSKYWAGNSLEAKTRLSRSPSKLLPFLFKLWPFALRREQTLKALLEVLCTLCSESDDAKKSLAAAQDGRLSVLSQVLDYVSRPATASEHNFRLALKLLGVVSTSKEGRQLLIKSKYPQGLVTRLVKLWNENKDPTVVPMKSPGMLEFLATIAFYTEGQKAISSVNGVIEMLSELMDRFTTHGIKYEIVEKGLLLLRNLCFSSKAHVLSHPSALTLLLACTSTPSQKAYLRSLSSSAIWALLYNNQKVKGVLARPQVLKELESVYREVNRDLDRQQKMEDLEHYKDLRTNLHAVLQILN